MGNQRYPTLASGARAALLATQLCLTVGCAAQTISPAATPCSCKCGLQQEEAEVSTPQQIPEDQIAGFSLDDSKVVSATYLNSEHPPQLKIAGLDLTNQPLERGAPGDEKIFASLHISNDGDDQLLLSSVGESDCVEMTPSIEVLSRDEEVLVVDAKIRCESGSSVLRVSVIHLVVAVSSSPMVTDYGTSRVLFSGQSKSIRNGGFSLESRRYEFYVEGSELVVYQHDVGWCDEAAMTEAKGVGGCEKRARTLSEVERVRL